MEYLQIAHEKIHVDDITSRVTSEDCGAISVFIGTTRNHFNNKKVLRLEYEAYEPMALKEMSRICKKMRELWPAIKNVAIVHRVGEVPVKEASVVVAACSEHRKEAQEAVMWGINAVKSKVPIWKKEVYADGTTSWKENNECAWKHNGNVILNNC